jgi:hypothetical protein
MARRVAEFEVLARARWRPAAEKTPRKGLLILTADPMMHLLLATGQDEFAAAARRLAADQQVWTWPTAMATGDPGVQRVEFTVGDATCELDPAEIRDIVAALVAS